MKLNDVYFIFKVANHGHNAETCNDASMNFFMPTKQQDLLLLLNLETTLSYEIGIGL